MPPVIEDVCKIRSEYRLDDSFLRERRAFYKGYLKDAENTDEFSREWLIRKYKSTFLDFLSKKIPVYKFESTRDISVHEYISSLSPHYPILSRLVDTIKVENYLDIVKSLGKNRVCRVFVWDERNGYTPRSSKYFDLRAIPECLRPSILPWGKDSQFILIKIENMIFKILLNITKEKDIFSDAGTNADAILACRLFSVHPSDINDGIIKFSRRFLSIFDSHRESLTGKLSRVLGIPEQKANFHLDRFFSIFPKISSYVHQSESSSQYLLPDEFYSLVNNFIRQLFAIDSGIIPVIPLDNGGLFEVPKYARIDPWTAEINQICGQYGMKPVICSGLEHW